METMPSRDWLTTAEAAELVGITRRAMSHRARHGRVRAVLRGGVYLIDPSGLEPKVRNDPPPPAA
jgi:hypothetical protein